MCISLGVNVVEAYVKLRPATAGCLASICRLSVPQLETGQSAIGKQRLKYGIVTKRIRQSNI